MIFSPCKWSRTYFYRFRFVHIQLRRFTWNINFRHSDWQINNILISSERLWLQLFDVEFIDCIKRCRADEMLRLHFARANQMHKHTMCHTYIHCWENTREVCIKHSCITRFLRFTQKCWTNIQTSNEHKQKKNDALPLCWHTKIGRSVR